MFKSSRWVTGVLAVSAAFSLTYCGKAALPPSHSNLSEGQAQQDIELRLVKTQEVHTKIKAIREAIKPIQGMLRDLGQQINIKVDAQPGDAVTSVFEKLQSQLKDALTGLVKIHSDGTWHLDRPGRVYLSGSKTSEGEDITVSVSASETLAVIHLHGNGNIEIVLSPAMVGAIKSDAGGAQPCELRIDHEGTHDFGRTPLQLGTGKTLVGIDQFEYHSDSSGTHGLVRTTLNGIDNAPIGTAVLKLEPNLPAQIRVCLQGESCAN